MQLQPGNTAAAGFRRRRSRVARLALAVPALVGAAVLGAGASPLFGAVAGGGGFVVVVNADNPLSGLPAAGISKLFLRTTTRWRSGEPVLAADLVEDAPARESFSRAVHGRSVGAVKAYWQRMIFSGRDVPPPERSGVDKMLAFVRANLGAVGYVPAGTPLPEGVRALRVLP